MPLTRDRDGWVASIALAALAERDDVPSTWVDWAPRKVVRPSFCEDELMLRALERARDGPDDRRRLPASAPDEPVVAFVLARIVAGGR